MDEELFELCKQVYEATKFETGEWFEITENLIVTDEDKYIMEQDTVDTPYDFIPRYTSDYLLDKLPDGVELLKREKGYAAVEPPRLRLREMSVFYDTPLQALLKLVIALDDAGQLVAAETTA